MARNNDRALTVKMPTELYDQLRACAEAQDRTVASLLRVLAREYLDGVATGPMRNRPSVRDGVA